MGVGMEELGKLSNGEVVQVLRDCVWRAVKESWAHYFMDSIVQCYEIACLVNSNPTALCHFKSLLLLAYSVLSMQHHKHTQLKHNYSMYKYQIISILTQ